jgi:hypothetical protein
MSWVRNIENCSSFAESLSGQREFVTMKSRSIAVPESRSVSTRPLNHMTPKTGRRLALGDQRQCGATLEEVVRELLRLRLIDRQHAHVGLELAGPGRIRGDRDGAGEDDEQPNCEQGNVATDSKHARSP